MANKKGTNPSSRSTRSRGSADDAFTARILEVVAWTRKNTQAAIIGAVVIVLLVGGTVYYLSQRSQRLAEAAQEFETIQQVAATAPVPEAAAEIDSYLVRFDGTPYEIEARLLLAELHLNDGNPEAAIDTLLDVAPAYGESLNVQATFLLGTAYEEAERWDAAQELYRELMDQSEFSFQQREAGEGLARVLLAEGDTAAAADAFRTLIEVEESDSPLREYFQMRLAELTAGEA